MGDPACGEALQPQQANTNVLGFSAGGARHHRQGPKMETPPLAGIRRPVSHVDL